MTLLVAGLLLRALESHQHRWALGLGIVSAVSLGIGLETLPFVAATAAILKGSIRHFVGDNGLFTTEESARRYAAHRAFIEHELARAEAEDAETVVVITHHAPSPICVRPWYRDSKVNGAFASNLDDLIERYRPRLWIHGHMHDRVDERLGATRIIANPHGFSLIEGADFEPNLIVTV